jgi:hypothetical protein
MRHTLFVAFFASIFWLLPISSNAQVAAYITYSPTNFELYNIGNNSSYINNGVVNGGSAGVTFDHLHEGRFVTAVDLRGSFQTKTHIRGATGAIDYRVAFVPTRVPLKPFIQLGLGFVTVHDPNNPVYLTTPSTTRAFSQLV